MLFKKEIHWQCEVVNLDDEWRARLSAVVNAGIGDKQNRNAEARYDRRYITSTDQQFHAERLLDLLETKYVTHEFAAHTDPEAPTWWRILVRTKAKRAVSAPEIKKIYGAAKIILRNVEKKYPPSLPNPKPASSRTCLVSSAEEGLELFSGTGSHRLAPSLAVDGVFKDDVSSAEGK